MAKETSIIFVYDSEKVKKEEDDPASAILYFHPTWVSDQQKAALCGQIIGTTRCVKSFLAKPKIVTLQSGKFFITEFGRYLLSVGTDRNINDWMLEHRAKTLISLLNFFHKDFESLSTLYADESLSAKLYHIFETYLKMLVFGGNIFSHIPVLNLPKSASNVFMEAVHILECCQALDGVLGGSMMYHNKVVATQLSPDLTKRLILTDPYRIKCPAETVNVTFDLPLGVQLLQVYIGNEEYNNLVESSTKGRNVSQFLMNKDFKKVTNKPNMETQFVSAMKRDQSLIFTAVPEEDSDQQPSGCPFVPSTKKNRPKFLNLKTISIDEKGSEIAKPVTKPASTPFCGQRSVCSTPMTELKKIIHQTPLSICRNDDLEKEKCAKTKNGGTLENFIPYVKIAANFFSKKKCLSLVDFNEIANSISKDASQYFRIKTNGLIDIDLDTSTPKKYKKLQRLKTITDPTFPVFKQDGTIISRYYYNYYIETDLELVQNMVQTKKDVLPHTEPCLNNHVKIQEIHNANKCTEIPKITNKKINKEHRKSLTLPLKSLSTDGESATETIVNRRYSSGVQLTPLMSKLSMLAFEERLNKETTPTQPNFNFSYNNKLKLEKDKNDNRLEKCILFVCGQQDVVLTVLLKEEGREEPNTIKKLWEICTEHLGKLEKQLVHCMESQSGANVRESEPYSYLCLDSDWDTTKRGGPWGTNDMGMLNVLHRDFETVPNLTDVLLRSGESVIYAHHCGPTEVFYHESANPISGLPPPADPMGLVQLKAKRRLERDHTIILL